jgi:hypothetical protein
MPLKPRLREYVYFFSSLFGTYLFSLNNNSSFIFALICALVLNGFYFVDIMNVALATQLVLVHPLAIVGIEHIIG